MRIGLILILILSLLAGGLTTSANQEPESKFYDPIERHIEGWLVRIDPRLTEQPNKDVGDRALAMLRWQLESIKISIPEKRLVELQTIGIWIELDNPQVSNMQYHPDRKWLIGHGMDPRFEGFVHIPGAARLADKKFFHQQPSVIMHELAHGFHDQILDFNYAPIVAAYKAGVKAGLYDKVLHASSRQLRHYSATNHKEYFAEGCEAYFGRNDFFPFVRVELRKHDPTLYRLMEEIWGKE